MAEPTIIFYRPVTADENIFDCLNLSPQSRILKRLDQSGASSEERSAAVSAIARELLAD